MQGFQSGKFSKYKDIGNAVSQAKKWKNKLYWILEILEVGKKFAPQHPFERG